ncbi:hypothetical protein RMSM_04233 [Rhodopirellula maiorica SM1]|uniref:Uncharacterized protein n=1 Tax=Rhodopirellula maiorica SM1 TaxID=1265738 RepID=M5RY47_9BACT|nr:hypothetical protein RMSM_04233 [Rhodopirellula maiorica SM1]
MANFDSGVWRFTAGCQLGWQDSSPPRTIDATSFCEERATSSDDKQALRMGF